MRKDSYRVLSWSLCLAALVVLTGCSSFERAWKDSLARPFPAQGVTGPWVGTWLSDSNGHNGALRCILTQTTNNAYEAWFKAKYRKVIPLTYAYKVTLEVLPVQDGVFTFSGKENLGALAGGVYHYEGRIAGTNFFSTYRCRIDHGTFRMSRPGARP